MTVGDGAAHLWAWIADLDADGWDATPGRCPMSPDFEFILLFATFVAAVLLGVRSLNARRGPR
jgi:hypothetical protein